MLRTPMGELRPKYKDEPIDQGHVFGLSLEVSSVRSVKLGNLLLTTIALTMSGGDIFGEISHSRQIPSEAMEAQQQSHNHDSMLLTVRSAYFQLDFQVSEKPNWHEFRIW